MVEHATGWSPAEQVAALEDPLTERQARHLEAMVGRRTEGEPLQYVLGRWAFRGLDLLVDNRVLIPRPETEVVAGLAVDLVPQVPGGAVVVDLGTGSGAIALSLAAECRPGVQVWGTDVSAEALAVARANLAGLGRRAASVRLAEGDWYGALAEDLRGRVHVIVSNPPYVATSDPLPAEVSEWEPSGALIAGPTGLEAIERIVFEAPGWLAPEGCLVLEIGATQGDDVVELARDAAFATAEVHPDLASRPRVLVARSARVGHG